MIWLIAVLVGLVGFGVGYRFGVRAGLREAHKRDRALIRKSREDAHLVEWWPRRP